MALVMRYTPIVLTIIMSDTDVTTTAITKPIVIDPMFLSFFPLILPYLKQL